MPSHPHSHPFRTPLAYRPASAPLPGLEVPPVLPQPHLPPPPPESEPAASLEPVLASNPPTGPPSIQGGPSLGPSKAHQGEGAIQQLTSTPASGPLETLASGFEAGSSTVFDFLGLGGQGSSVLAEEVFAHRATVCAGQGEGTDGKRQPEKRSRPEGSDSGLCWISIQKPAHLFQEICFLSFSLVDDFTDSFVLLPKTGRSCCTNGRKIARDLKADKRALSASRIYSATV